MNPTAFLKDRCQNATHRQWMYFAMLRGPAASSLTRRHSRRFEAMTSSLQEPPSITDGPSRLHLGCRIGPVWLPCPELRGAALGRVMCLRCGGSLSGCVGCPSAWPVAIYCYPPGSDLPTQSCSCRYLGTSCQHCTCRALPVLGQIFAVALLHGGMQAAAPPPASNRNQQG